MILRATPVLILVLTLVILPGCVTSPKPPEAPRPIYQRVDWSQIDGWREGRTHEAWGAFLHSCKARGTRPEWVGVCRAARQHTPMDPVAARRFFETHFDAYRLQQEADTQRPRDTGLITGYYEPLLYGTRKPTPCGPQKFDLGLWSGQFP